jgi:hypothetical protein
MIILLEINSVCWLPLPLVVDATTVYAYQEMDKDRPHDNSANGWMNLCA